MLVMSLLLALLTDPAGPNDQLYESRLPDGGLIDATLLIRADGTYHYVNQTGSCWIDWDDRGRWHEQDGLLVLRSENLRTWSTATFSPDNGHKSGLQIRVIDHRGKPIQGALIRLGDGSVQESSNSSGGVEFDEADLARVVGSAEWVTYLAEDQSGFAQLRGGSWIMTVVSGRDEQPTVTYVIRAGRDLKQLGGLDLTFSRCP